MPKFLVPSLPLPVAVLAPLAVVASLATLTGCSKVSALLGKGGDGGADESSGGLLSGLKKDDGLSLSAFEGEIDISAKGNPPGAPIHPGAAANAAPQNVTLALLVKDKRFRMDIPSNLGAETFPVKGYGVLDGPAKKAFLVTDTPEKAAIVFDLNSTGEQLKSMAAKNRAGTSAGKESKPPKVVKTGRKEKIAGYDCEDWEITSEDKPGEKITMCVSQQGFSWFQIPLVGAPAEYAWAGELADGTHFPLKISVTEKDGKESAHIEVTKVDKKPLDAKLFEIPADHPQMTFEQMIGKMISGAGAGAGRIPVGGMPAGMPAGLPAGAREPHGGHH